MLFVSIDPLIEGFDVGRIDSGHAVLSMIKNTFVAIPMGRRIQELCGSTVFLFKR
jgi:hypothetical protein